MVFLCMLLQKYPHILIILLSALLSAALWHVTFINFFPDSEQYVRTAFALINQPGEFYYYRTWGYSIFLVLLGVTTFHTFYLLLVAQALLGIAMPLIVFATIQPFSKKTALVTAVLVAISFTPFIWQKLIMTDQIAMFLYYLLAYVAMRFIFYQSYKSLVMLGIIGFLLFLMRPSAMLIYFCTLGCLLLFNLNVWKRIIGAACVFIMSVLFFQVFQYDWVSKYNDKHHIQNSFTHGSMVGRMFFFNIYGAAPFFTNELTVSPQNGSCSNAFYQHLLQWSEKNTPITNKYLANKNATDFVNKLLSEPNLQNHAVMWLALDQRIGSVRADRLFACTAVEGLIKHPSAILLFVDGFVEFFMSGDVVYNSGKRVAWDASSITTAMLTKHLSNDPNFSNKLRNELTNEIKVSANKYETTVLTYKILFYWQTAFKIVASILALMLLPLCLLAERRIACMATLIAFYLVYQSLVATVFAAPHFRYSSPQIPFIIMLAALGIYSSIKRRNITYKTGQ